MAVLKSERQITPATGKKTKTRWLIVLMIFIVTVINYADRATLSIAGPALSSDLGINSVMMGYLFSAFAWSYVLGQIPGGWLLDKFGSKRVYFWSIFLWSLFTLVQGLIGSFQSVTTVVIILFALRFFVGLAESPSFPANSRIVAAWFPSAERGTAAAIFNSGQYFATVLFAPIMGYITFTFGWEYVFFFMGAIGIIVAFVWLKTIYNPKDHPKINQAELDYIKEGGALVDMDTAANQVEKKQGPNWQYIKQLLSNKMLLGVYLGQYCITTLTYFFLTWFPVYLVDQRGMNILEAGLVASLPAICGFIGGILGGTFSDFLLKKGVSITAARKIPIITGLLLSMSLVIANYVTTEWVVVFVMSLAFFGKGFGSLGWAVVADTSPKEMSGVSGGLFNTFGNVAGITTPIIIGYIVGTTGSFNMALLFVGASALVAILSYLFLVGEIKRVELKKV
ncbi:MFS transporter [Cytobacillus sp. FSL W7-1323]|uniref:MFS transporter n=1 Tax=Cytobacillus kochii TaxID=859143 RepID=A0A248TF61_9BACI|nr:MULTISPECIES: MFS transporter [Cytobacillus]ASV66841.1 MFS transporter [Cytobacillus kochii]MDQ0187861.1 ACS family glucarate transporter-like MFS transporter [Cytobacillus kochii]MEA1853990.1 MFS transporter [Cytobacillus sp. OWB-43]MED1605360.1 MFS transporter [Cytobacillus kochii]